MLTYLLSYMARDNRAPTVGANRLMGQYAYRAKLRVMHCREQGG
jgi:hypothetical protein